LAQFTQLGRADAAVLLAPRIKRRVTGHRRAKCMMYDTLRQSAEANCP
jgi:hypothetical protein